MATTLDDNAPDVSSDELDTVTTSWTYSSSSQLEAEETSADGDSEVDGRSLEEIKFNLKKKVELKPSTFENAAKALLTSKEETFSNWLDQMEAQEKWNPDCPLDLQKARAIQDFKVTELQTHGRLFNPEINKILGGDPAMPEKPGKKKPRSPVFLFLGTSEIGEFRKRLEIACKSFHGIGKDLDAIGKLMESKQLENKQQRQKLKECFESFESLYGKLGTEVQDLLALDANTLEIIQTHKDLLDDDSCPIVVAGQVSSGKSSLLNLFLSAGGRKEAKTEDGKCSDPFTLPVSTLACTGRVCEISYNDRISAKLYQDKIKQEKEIEIDEISKHVDMYGQEATYKAEENIRDVVKLGLPIPFLKGGVTLVDTPGVGENVQDSEIVRNYIAKNNVFGFIFTIHTSAGSGVNLKFQQLLRDLSKYEDENGNKKLDPEAVIFVCNFWDQIKPEERVSTTKRVLEILESTGFMKDFDPTKQLLFMNSKGAFDTWKVGYMSEDYNKLIDAMERFFEVGHKRKLLQSYVWFHSLMQRVLRSVKFLQFWAQDIGANTKNTFAEKLQEKLKKIKKAHHKEISLVRHDLPKSADSLAETLLTHLKSKKDSVFNFTKNDILQLEDEKDNRELQELKMDMLIDSQIGNVLNDWEAKTKCVYKEKKRLENCITFVANFSDTRLGEFERRSVSVEKFKDSVEAIDKTKYQNAKELAENIRGLSVDKTQMDIAFGCTYGNALMKGCSIKQRAAMAGASIVTDIIKMKSKGKVSVLPRQAMSMYLQWKNFQGYLEYRAKTILTELMHKSVLTQIMLGHLKPVEELITSVEEATESRIVQNEKLIQVMKSELFSVMGTPEKKHEFFHKGSGINEIFSRLLNLGYAAELEAIPFGNHNLEQQSEILSCGRYGNVYTVKASGTITMAGVTVAREADMVSVKITRDSLTESEQFFVLCHIRKINEAQHGKHVPMFLGLSERGYGLVFSGLQTTAKNFFTETLKDIPVEEYRQEVANFLLHLADGIQYLHYKQLVHPEVSVESVLVENGLSGRPMLSNISEKGPLRIHLLNNEPVGNAIYLPPECLQGSSKDSDQLKSWYTSAGDIYGLGTVMTELCSRQADVFNRLKATNFKKWGSKSDAGNAIMFATGYDRKEGKEDKMSLPKEWKDLCLHCLAQVPEKRVSADMWIVEWKKLKEMAHVALTDFGNMTETKEATASNILQFKPFENTDEPL